MTKPAREQELADAIESLIDHYGIDHFLQMSGFVTGEKAEHIAHAWQDASRAKHWMSISTGLDKLTAKAEEWDL